MVWPLPGLGPLAELTWDRASELVETQLRRFRDLRKLPELGRDVAWAGGRIVSGRGREKMATIPLRGAPRGAPRGGFRMRMRV